MNTTICNTCPSFGGFFKFMFLLALFAILLAVATQLSFHAVLQHGSDAEVVRNCLSKNGEIMRGFTQDGKIIKVCQIEPFKYGLQFLVRGTESDFREVTSYIYRKEKGSTLQQLLDYFTRQNIRIVVK